MRTTALFLLGALCLLPPIVRAQGEEALTAKVPSQSPISVRIASLDRIDALAKEIAPLVESIEPGAAGPLSEVPPSQMLAQMMGMEPGQLDGGQAMVLAMAMGQPVVFMEAPEGAVLDEPRALPEGMELTLSDGVYRVAPAGLDLSGVETRTTTTSMLPGDLSLHVYLDEVVERNRAQIEGALGFGTQMAKQQGQAAGPFAALFDPMGKLAMKAVDGAASFDYALTWKDGLLETEGLLRSRDESALSGFIARMGKPGGNGLAGFLPRDALIVYDSVGNPDWPTKEMEKFFGENMGEGAGQAITRLMNMAAPLQAGMTGRQAGSVQLAGMMGVTATQIVELKEGTDPATLFDGYDVDAANAAMETLGLPMTYNFVKEVDVHGETPIHQVIMQSTDPQMAMMTAMMQVFMAAENGHLFVVTGPTAMTDLRDLLDRVRSGNRIEHPHLAAMQRLGRERNLGMSFNVGGIKAFGAMFAMMDPNAMKVMNVIPDELYLSTAITNREGDLHWRGDWPVRKLAKIAATIAEMERGEAEGEEAPPPPEREPDFD